MLLDLETTTGKNFIQSFTPGKIKVNNVDYMTHLLISADSIDTWNIDSINAVSQHHLQAMLEYKPEVIIIGTGTSPFFLPAPLLLFVQQQRIGIESMTTAAACRTFNVLLNEGRRVLAALII